MRKRTCLFSQPAGVGPPLAYLDRQRNSPHARPGEPSSRRATGGAGRHRGGREEADFENGVILSAASRPSTACRSSARVTGYLEAILFKEGDTIKEGAPVYRLEKGQFEAAVKQAEGALERDKAAKVLTVVQLQRAEDLVKRSAPAPRWRATRRSRRTSRRAGAILEAEANLQTAQDQSRLHRHHLADCRQDRPHQRHQGQRGRPRHRRADHDRQPGPDVRHVPGEPARFPARAADRHRGRTCRRSRSGCDIRTAPNYAETGTLNFVDVSVDRAPTP